MKNYLPLIFLSFFLAVAYMLFWPAPIHPVAWEPGPSYGVTGKTEPVSIERFALASGRGPEHVEPGPDGALYMGLAGGEIVRISGENQEIIGRTGGRPLGMAFDAAGRLVICDGEKGLLRLDPDSRRLETLLDEFAGKPLLGANDLAIADDGSIYFSVSSRRFGIDAYVLDIVENRASGLVLRFEPKDGSVRKVASGLHFANGVALLEDEGVLLVNETARYRVVRIPLSPVPGERKPEVFIYNLPGFPDGLDCSRDGLCWVAIVDPRSPLLDTLAPFPILRSWIVKLPGWMVPMPPRTARIIGFGTDGRLSRDLWAQEDPPVTRISSATPHAGFLYIGSLDSPAYGRIRLGN